MVARATAAAPTLPLTDPEGAQEVPSKSPRQWREQPPSASSWAALWERPHGQIAALDCLRAIAVLLVICSHYTEEFGRRVVPAIGNSPYARLPMFYWGWTGVDLFFILSGFLIGRQLWKERFRTGTINIKRFLLRRGFRIWPLYFVTLAAMALFQHRMPRLPDLLFYSNYVQGRFDRGWSLSTEEQFYILVPLFLLATWRFKSGRAYAVSLLVLLALVAESRYFTLKGLIAAGARDTKIADALYSPFHLHCEALIAGLALALFTVRRPDWFKANTRPGKLSVIGLATFLGASAVGIGLRTAGPKIFNFLALALIFGSLAFWLLLDRSPVTRIASWRGFLPVSRLSYGMYLNHLYVLPVLTSSTIAFMRARGMPQPVWFSAGLSVGIATSMVVAFLTYVAIEKPFLRLRDRLVAGSE